MKIILFRGLDGSPCLVVPTPEAVDSAGLHFIAQKDVPAGHRYLVMDVDEIPPFEVWGGWPVADADLTSGVGGDFGAGSLLDVTAVAQIDGDCWVRCRNRETGELTEFCLDELKATS